VPGGSCDGELDGKRQSGYLFDAARAHESSDWFLVDQATGIRTELGGQYDGIEIRHGSFLGC